MPTMSPVTSPEEQLRAENADLRARLAQAQETLRAIRSGEVWVESARDISSRKQAETNLVDVTRRFEIALSMAPVTLFQQDLDLRYTWIYNPALGYNSAQVIGKRDGDLFERAQDAANTEAIKREVMRTGARQRRDILVHAEGVDHYYDLLVEPLVDKGGSITGVTCAAIEITERKRSAAQAQRVSALLDTLLHNAHIGFCFLDRDLRFVRINERLAEMNGASVEAHLGRHVSEIVPELVESLCEMTGRIVATGEAMLNHKFSGKTPAAPGLTRFWNESWYPVRDGAGEIVGFGAVVEEITERLQAQEALRESEGRFRALSIASSEVGYSMSPDWSEMRPLDGRSLLASADAGSRTWLRDYNHPEDQLKILARVHESIQTKSIFELEHRVRRLDGTWGWTLSRAVPILDAQGDIIEWFGTASDVTARKQAEHAILESQQFTRRVLDNLFAFVAVTAADGTLIDVNRAPLEAAGMPASEVLGKKFWDCYWWSYAPEIQAQLRDACERAAAGEAVRYDVPVRMEGDKRMWIDFQVAPLRDTEGRITHLIPSAMDLTVRRAAEERLRASEARFRAAVGAVSDIIWTNNAAGEMEGEQPTWGAFTGQRQEDYRGHGWSQAVHPEDAQPTIDAWALAVAEKRRFEFEHRVRRHDGAWRLCSIRAVPVLDSGGEILEWVGVHTDITERELAAKMNQALLLSSLRHQEELRASEERTRLATKATAVGVWEWNVLTNRIRWDTQMFLLYGIPPTADGFLKYTDWSGTVLPEDLPETERILQDTLRCGGQSRRQFRIRRRDDGAERHVESVEAVRANAQGVTEWVVGTNLDVTEQRTAAIQLRQLAADLSEADRRKDEFLATLAHELRNPLAPIRTGLQLMKLTGLPAAAVEKTRSMMDRQLTHMVRLIDDLMDVSRISRGKLELQRERVALAAVVNSAVESSSPLIEQMGHQLTVTLPKQEIMVDADMTRLAQVVLNLLNNAAKYSDRGGHIQLNVEREGGDAVVTVKDTGIGIAADQLPRVFRMFTQVDRSLERSQGGLGIGLTLVKRLVDLHGGVVEARSAGLGKGSEFVVRLPIVVETSKPQAPGVEDEPAAPKSSLRILIVDDNRDGADSLSELLKMMGNDTRTAYDGQQGVALAGEYRPDVILLDIGLPTLNGYEACHLIRQQPWSQDVLLIAVTGWGQDDDRRRSHEAGFDHHMVKPVDPQALMSMIAGLNGSHADQPNNRTQ